jgi:hypothetical protein
MKWQANPYALPPFAIAFILLGISFVAWRRRPGNGERHFILVMLVMALWLAGYGFELSSVDFSTLFFWVRVEYFGITALPVLWLTFVLVYAGPPRWLNPTRRVFLFVMPLITLALVWTNDYHHLIWATTGLDMSGPFPAFARTHGPWFWVHTAYSYLCLAGALVVGAMTVLFGAPGVANAVEPVCGDGVCDPAGENSDLCHADCECVDDGVADPGEGCGCKDVICEDEAPITACGTPCGEDGQCPDGLQCDNTSQWCWDSVLCIPPHIPPPHRDREPRRIMA